MEQPSRNQLIESIVRVLEPRDEILEAYLFGSRARGASGPLADVDVAVFLDRTDAGAYPFGYPAELATVLMRELRTNAIDVVVLNGAPPLLYGNSRCGPQERASHVVSSCKWRAPAPDIVARALRHW